MATTHTTMGTYVRKRGLLYPTLVIAGIAVIVFSAVGVATMMGWMPSAQSGSNTASTPVASQQQLAAADSKADRAVDSKAESSAAATTADESRAPASAPAPDCTNCGVIASIRTVQVKGDSTWMGAGGGAAVGALVGSQFGSGRGKTVAGAVGAGAGAYGGTVLEQHLRKSVKYQIRVRMDDGTQRTFTRSAKPQFAVGQKVRITEKGIVDAAG